MPNYTLKEIQQKLEHFCAYQERCHSEVLSKLIEIQVNIDEIDIVIVHLIENNFLNEERFACSFARGKHRIKKWGKIRITNELKHRNISTYNINKALKEIDSEDYLEVFAVLAKNYWETSQETNKLKKRKKFCDFLLRKGYESHLVYSKLLQLE